MRKTLRAARPRVLAPVKPSRIGVLTAVATAMVLLTAAPGHAALPPYDYRDAPDWVPSGISWTDGTAFSLTDIPSRTRGLSEPSWRDLISTIHRTSRATSEVEPPTVVERPDDVTTWRAAAGKNRYATAVAISWQFALGDVDGDGDLGDVTLASNEVWSEQAAPVVYVATGRHFADALSAGPAAGHLGGPLLLTSPNSLPTIVADEIRRLQPRRIVVVGGPGAISEDVYQQLARLAPQIRRDGGANRYQTSRIVNERAFTRSDDWRAVVFATGRAFPDAIGAAGVAGAMGGPTVLLDGQNSHLPNTGWLERHPITSYVVAGGEAAISDHYMHQLETYRLPQWHDGTRFAGVDRYRTAALLNADMFPLLVHLDSDQMVSIANPPVEVTANDDVILVSGTSYADAVAVSALAAYYGDPVLLARPSCVPRDTREAVEVMRPWRSAFIVGGYGAVSEPIDHMTLCNR